MKLSRIKNRLFKNFLAGLAIGVGILTSALLAVTVTGTFNTFSAGALLKSSDINTNFATLKAAIESIPSQPSMRLIYETDVTTATNTVTVSGLDGNTDLSYMIHTRIVSNQAAGCDIVIRPNNDTTTTNYGLILINSTASVITPVQYTSYNGMYSGNNQTTNQVSSCRSFLYAKTNFVRHLITDCMDAGTGTTIQYKDQYGSAWNNTASNITSLVFFSACASGIGAGSHIEVWARR